MQAFVHAGLLTGRRADSASLLLYMGEADPYQLLKREEMSRGLRLFLEKVWLGGFVISFVFVLPRWRVGGPGVSVVNFRDRARARARARDWGNVLALSSEADYETHHPDSGVE
jgi:hypothetical protein